MSTSSKSSLLRFQDSNMELMGQGVFLYSQEIFCFNQVFFVKDETIIQKNKDKTINIT